MENQIFNSQLTELYNDYYPKLLTKLSSFNPQRKISQPLLINCFDSYQNSIHKLMVIGQETKFWADGNKLFLGDIAILNPVEYLMNKYKQFDLGSSYYSSPFWNFSHKINSKINPNNDGRNFIWNNISKVDENGGRVSEEVASELMKLNYIVYDEVELLKPDVIIFLTGYNYDKYIEQTFPGIKFITGIPRKYAKLEHDKFPNTKMYRTYHPNYLRRSGKENEALNLLVQNIIGTDNI